MIGRNDLWAVVPVAGFGSRLRPHTYTRPKPLLSVAGQPIIGHILDQLVPLGVRRIVLVVSDIWVNGLSITFNHVAILTRLSG